MWEHKLCSFKFLGAGENEAHVPAHQCTTICGLCAQHWATVLILLVGVTISIMPVIDPPLTPAPQSGSRSHWCSKGDFQAMRWLCKMRLYREAQSSWRGWFVRQCTVYTFRWLCIQMMIDLPWESSVGHPGWLHLEVLQTVLRQFSFQSKNTVPPAHARTHIYCW